MTEPTLDEIVAMARALADDVEVILQRIPSTLDSVDLERRVAVLRAQVAALRGMRPDADGFLPERLTWSMGQSVAVVLRSALRRLIAAGFVTTDDVEHCAGRARELAAALQRYETA